MVEFGRIGYVTKREKISGKFEDRAIKCVFIGYGKHHSGDTYRMYNPGTKRIILSRDVKWAEFKRIDPKANMDVFVQYDATDTVPGIDEIVVNVQDGPDDNGGIVEIADDKNQDEEKVDENKNDQSDSGSNADDRLKRELRRLDTSYNPTVKQEEKQVERDGNVIVTGNANAVPIEIPEEEMGNYCEEIHNTSVHSDVGDPKTFEEAMSGRRGRMWRFSAISEANNFLYRDAWIPTSLKTSL